MARQLMYDLLAVVKYLMNYEKMANSEILRRITILASFNVCIPVRNHGYSSLSPYASINAKMRIERMNSKNGLKSQPPS